jgi:hypothetical protein
MRSDVKNHPVENAEYKKAANGDWIVTLHHARAGKIKEVATDHCEGLHVLASYPGSPIRSDRTLSAFGWRNLDRAPLCNLMVADVCMGVLLITEGSSAAGRGKQASGEPWWSNRLSILPMLSARSSGEDPCTIQTSVGFSRR